MFWTEGFALRRLALPIGVAATAAVFLVAASLAWSMRSDGDSQGSDVSAELSGPFGAEAVASTEAVVPSTDGSSGVGDVEAGSETIEVGVAESITSSTATAAFTTTSDLSPGQSTTTTAETSSVTTASSATTSSADATTSSIATASSATVSPPTTAGSTSIPTTHTTTAQTTTPQTTTVAESGSYRRCVAPSGGQTTLADFGAMRRSGQPASDLNSGSANGERTFLRTVFSLDSGRLRWGSEGVELAVDPADAEAVSNRYRGELRETVIDQPIPVGSTQMYCMRFRVDELPDLFGPLTIFQRFNRDIDGPDIEVELTGANQFSNATPNDIQVVAWDGRHRIGRQLDTINTLLVVVHNHGSNGSYKVVLNGQTLRQASGVDTTGAAAGGWSQFGLYPHGLYGDGDSNRQDQINSGRTRIQFEYRDFSITSYSSGPADLSGFTVAG